MKTSAVLPEPQSSRDERDLRSIAHWKEFAREGSPLRWFRGSSPKTNGMVAGLDLTIIDGKTWRHLSVSRRSRTPTHDDMMAAAEALLDQNVKTLSIYPPRAEWVNVHEHCLHLWQPIGFDPVPDPKLERARAVGMMTDEERADFEAWRAEQQTINHEFGTTRRGRLADGTPFVLLEGTR